MATEGQDKSVNNRQESRARYEKTGRLKTETTHASMSVRVKLNEAQEVRRLLSALKSEIRALNQAKTFKENLGWLVDKLAKKSKPTTPLADQESEAFSTLTKLPG